MFWRGTPTFQDLSKINVPKKSLLILYSTKKFIFAFYAKNAKKKHTAIFRHLPIGVDKIVGVRPDHLG